MIQIVRHTDTCDQCAILATGTEFFLILTKSPLLRVTHGYQRLSTGVFQPESISKSDITQQPMNDVADSSFLARTK